jgi:hypothetical protein
MDGIFTIISGRLLGFIQENDCRSVVCLQYRSWIYLELQLNVKNEKREIGQAFEKYTSEKLFRLRNQKWRCSEVRQRQQAPTMLLLWMFQQCFVSVTDYSAVDFSSEDLLYFRTIIATMRSLRWIYDEVYLYDWFYWNLVWHEIYQPISTL